MLIWFGWKLEHFLGFGFKFMLIFRPENFAIVGLYNAFF